MHKGSTSIWLTRHSPGRFPASAVGPVTVGLQDRTSPSVLSGGRSVHGSACGGLRGACRTEHHLRYSPGRRQVPGFCLGAVGGRWWLAGGLQDRTSPSDPGVWLPPCARRRLAEGFEDRMLSKCSRSPEHHCSAIPTSCSHGQARGPPFLRVFALGATAARHHTQLRLIQLPTHHLTHSIDHRLRRAPAAYRHRRRSSIDFAPIEHPLPPSPPSHWH